MAIELQGTLHFIGETQTFGTSFKKRGFILHIADPKDAKWDSYVPMAFTRDKVDLLDRYRLNEEVIVGVDIKGRLDKNDDRKAYADIEAWKIYYPEQPHQRGSSVDNRRREQSTQEDTRRHYPLEERAPNGRREPAPSSRGGSYKGVEPDEIEF